MTGMTQLLYGAATSNSAGVAERRYGLSGIRRLLAWICTQLTHLKEFLLARVTGLRVWGFHPEPKAGLRQAYLFSELRNCSLRRRLPLQLATERLLKLRGLFVSSMRTIWRWC